MSTEVATMQTFQEKITDKLRKDIGDLLPDEVLSQLIEKAIKTEFFEDRIDASNKFHPTTKQSWFVEEVHRLIKPMLESAVKDYVKDNESHIKDVVRDYLNTERLTLMANTALVQSLSVQMSESMYHFASEVANKIRNGY